MIDRGFVEKIEELSAENNIQLINGVTHSVKKMYPVGSFSADPIAVHTLEAIKGYCDKYRQDEMEEKFFILVNDPETVTVFSGLNMEYRERERFMVANKPGDVFNFGILMDVEKFIIALQASFVQDEVTEAILKIVGNITLKAESQTLDDGVRQTISAKVGIAHVENVVLPNPVMLRPYRTFIEVEQPESNFVLRIKATQGEPPVCSLHEADGGAWKIKAINNICEWLKAEVPGVTVLA